MLIAETHAARTLPSSNPCRSIAAIAASAGKCRTRQPASLTARDLLSADLPLGWDQQRQLLGFALSIPPAVRILRPETAAFSAGKSAWRRPVSDGTGDCAVRKPRGTAPLQGYGVSAYP